MPLTERVDFKAVLQKGNRVQVPKLLRWRFKLEASQALKATVTAANVFSGWETFYGRMDKSGRPSITQNSVKATAEPKTEQ